MMDSFYGGVNGQSFSISEIFTSKYQMDKDLAKGWTSPISVGEYVEVSYGMPNSSTYETYRNEDILQNGGKTYNSTLWQKCYNENTEGRSAAGLYYKLIASMTGNTPKIGFTYTLIAANGHPSAVLINPDDVDNPIIDFRLPDGWTMQHKLVNPESLPVLEVISTDEEGHTLEFPYLLLTLPKAWTFMYQPFDEEHHEQDFHKLKANQDPTFEFIKDFDNAKTTFKIGLPVSERINVVLGDPLPAGSEPDWDYDNGEREGSTVDPDHPVLTLYLPMASVVDIDEDVTEIGPGEKPRVEDIATDENPIIHFSLPRAVMFRYGDLLGAESNYTSQTSTEYAGLLKGDYYINKKTGRIYLITNVVNNAYDFEFVGCLQAPEPDAKATPISPYILDEDTNKYIPRDPDAVRGVNPQTTEWEIDFKMPKAAVPSADITFIGADERDDTDVVAYPKDNDTIQFDFTIPAGSRLYSGTSLDDSNVSSFTIDGALPGDYYLNVTASGAQAGNLYKWDGSIWTRVGSMKGPTGEWTVIGNYTFRENDGIANDVNVIGAEIEKPAYLGRVPYNFELIGVTYIKSNSDNISYWYFHTGTPTSGQWERVQLSGGTASLLQKTYLAAGDDNKTYTVTYINQLIGGAKNDTNKDITTYSKEQIDTMISKIKTWGKISELLTPGS